MHKQWNDYLMSKFALDIRCYERKRIKLHTVFFLQIFQTIVFWSKWTVQNFVIYHNLPKIQFNNYVAENTCTVIQIPTS